MGKFSVKKTKYTDFAKLIGKCFEDIRVLDTLLIPTTWNTSNVNVEGQRLHTKQEWWICSRTINCQNKIRAKSELVWTDTTFGSNTPKHYKISVTPPTDDTTLVVERNNMKLKHVIMDKKSWDSLKSAFQIKILDNNQEFKVGGDYNGPSNDVSSRV